MRKLLAMLGLCGAAAMAGEPKEGDIAPLFSVKNQKGETFNLADRKGKGWTVLFFYPKAETPGCTKQACAFRDSIKLIRDKGAELYGISCDTVEAQAKFHAKERLNFDLLADADAKISDLYGTRMPIIKISKRWTFILDDQLKIRHRERDVDPAKDASRVADLIAQLQKIH